MFDRLYALDFDADDEGKQRPRELALTPEGKRAWVGFHNAHADEQARLSGDLAAVWSKLRGYAARLALVIHLVRQAADDPTLAAPDAVDEQSIAASVVMIRWFGREAQRVYGLLNESEQERDLRRLAEGIEQRGGRITANDLRRSSRAYAKSADAEAALDALADAGLGGWRAVGPGPEGGRPTREFVLSPSCAVDTAPAADPPARGSGYGDAADSEPDDLAATPASIPMPNASAGLDEIGRAAA